MDRRTVIKGVMAGVAVAILPTLPVEEVKYVKTVTIGNTADEDYIQFGPNDVYKFTMEHWYDT